MEIKTSLSIPSFTHNFWARWLLLVFFRFKIQLSIDQCPVIARKPSMQAKPWCSLMTGQLLKIRDCLQGRGSRVDLCLRRKWGKNWDKKCRKSTIRYTVRWSRGLDLRIKRESKLMINWPAGSRPSWQLFWRKPNMKTTSFYLSRKRIR